ncbi:MAG: helix-turn-helix transcriptional regulator [Ruminococcaceae bacterium]|nr:helix-turn-helix transcriptional regulator [Oscillospiraceae bacterium]
MTFGEKLQTLRTGANLSQEELAERLSVSRQAVSKWELDKTVPDVKYIVAISELFQVTTDYLLKKTYNPPASEAEPEPACPQQAPPRSPARDVFPTLAICAVMLMLAADIIFTATNIFYIRALYTFSMIFLLLAMVFLLTLMTGWRVHLHTTASHANCRRIVSAGARLWCFGLMLLCGFHEVIHDLVVSPGLSAFSDDIPLVILTFLAVTFGLWATGRLAALLFPKS